MHTDIIMMIVFLIEIQLFVTERERNILWVTFSYLASLATVHPVVEARGLVAADAAQHVVIVVEF